MTNSEFQKPGGTFTFTDLRNQVVEYLMVGWTCTEDDVDTLMLAIMRKYGTVDINTIPTHEFNSFVALVME